MAKKKLSVLKFAISGKRVVPCDDSIVRGTQIRNKVRELKGLETWVAQRIDADSVRYNSIEAFVAALGIPRKHLCLKCWDGMWPSITNT